MQQTTLYEKIEAKEYGKRTTFEVKAPTEFLAIDPRIWVKYTFSFDGNLGQYFHGIDEDGYSVTGRTTDATIAFRQGWCVARGMLNVCAKINDKTVVQHQPRDYIDGLSRMFITKREAETQCSGGAFDSDTMVHDEESYLTDLSVEIDENGTDAYKIQLYPDLGSHSNEEGNYYMMLPGQDCKLYNKGFKKRRYKFFSEGMRNDTTSSVSEANIADRTVNADDCVFELWEPLPFEPFALFPKYQPGKELSCINRLEVRIEFENNLWDYMMCGWYTDTQRNEPDLYVPKIEMTVAPEICVRYIPRIIPPEKITSLNVHHSVYQIFDVDRSANTRLVKGTNTFTFDIAPDTDKVYFYMKRHRGDYEIPTEAFLGIEEIQIKTPNADHYLDARQLFDQYNAVSHNHDLEFDDYRYTKSVACISVRELRLDQRLHMIVKWRNLWKLPQMYTNPAYYIDDGSVQYKAVLIMDKKVEIHC